jgi:hypothetical protein
MLQPAATRLWPLLVGLPLEDGERRTLGIAKDGDLAGRTPSDASGVLPENQSPEVRPLRKGTPPSHRQGYDLPVLPRRRHNGRGFDNSHLSLFSLKVK